MRITSYNTGSVERAFSLLEMMLVIAIFTVIIGASYALTASARMSWHAADVRIELVEDFRQAVDTMANELSECAPNSASNPNRITIGAGGNSITFQVPVDVAGIVPVDFDADGINDFHIANTLAGAPNFNIQWGAYMRNEDKTLPSAARQGRRVIFRLAGDELHRITIGGDGAILEDFLLADDVQDPVATGGLDPLFAFVTNDVIAINISGRKLTADRYPIAFNISTAVHLRNTE